MKSSDNYLDSEQQFFENERKQRKVERKLAQRTDRSKYRKSDLDQAKKQLQEKILNENQLRGRVVEIRANEVFVYWQSARDPLQHATHLCHIKGSFKSSRSRTKNLIAVGDWVHYEMPSSQSQGYIQYIEPRRTVLSRADNLNHTKEQILAANVDKLVIVFSLCQPTISNTLIDRYLIAAQKGRLSPILVISKIDLLEDPTLNLALREKEKEKLELCLSTYSSLGIPIVCYRQDTPQSLRPLAKLLEDQVAVFSGSSGVGKSTIINDLSGRDLRTQPVCIKTGKGAHTTSHTQFISLKNGGWCVDTPGIRSFALWQLDRQSVDKYFEEFSTLAYACHFRDCSHKNEPGCSIRQAVEDGQVAPHRYESYISLTEELSSQHFRR